MSAISQKGLLVWVQFFFSRPMHNTFLNRVVFPLLDGQVLIVSLRVTSDAEAASASLYPVNVTPALIAETARTRITARCPVPPWSSPALRASASAAI